MEKYQLTTNWDEAIHTVKASSYEEAVEMFSMIKNLPETAIKRLFHIKKIK